MKYKIGKTTILTLLVIYLFFGVIAFISSSSNFINVSAQTTEHVNTNTQEYVINKKTGEKRTIIWTEGIDAPLMAADEDLETATGRYFRKKSFNEVDGTYSMYYYPMESGKNYFDFNKNPARTNIHPQQVGHHCYLATAMNLIYWWMSQNSTYIDQYIKLIEQGYFSQPSDLHPINDPKMWEKYRETPQVEYIQDRDYYSMDLSNNPMYREVFRSFQTRDEGYWPDLVWDSFFNGYTPEGKDPLYMPSRDGGFFYPLLGREPISKTINMGSYDFFSRVVLENLRAGNGIGLAFQSVGPAHAITIWGAEVDEQDKIKRIYFTDSDDFDHTEKTEEGILKGLYSNEVVEDKNGNPRLTTRDDRTKGSLINSIFILSLAQDRLENSLNDLTDPVVPKITENLPDLGYVNSNEKPRTLDVKVKKEDSGELTYQWYEANDLTSVGTKIEGATRSFYTPTPIVGQDKYYYCVVTNTKHNKTAKAVTNRSRVFVDENVINAQTPDVSYNLNNNSSSNIYKYNQYDQSKPLKINVTKKDEGIISYQWYERESLSTSSPVGGTPIEGEIYPVFYPKTNVSGVAVDYYCVVTNTNPNANGVKSVTVSPSRVLTVITQNTAKLNNALNPKILKHPQSEIKYDGTGEVPTLTVHASTADNGTLSYQWFVANDEYSDGLKIDGATESSYKPSTDENGTKYYYCEVTNTNTLAINNQTATVISNRTKLTIECKDFNIMARFGNDLSLIFLFKQNKVKGMDYYAVINHKGNTQNEIIIPQSEWKTYENNGIKYFAIEYSGIAGKQMSDIISIQIYNNLNQNITSVFETSIRDYGMKCLDLYQDSDIKTLIVDMLNYGASAQLYFEYNTNDLANKLLTAEQKGFASNLNDCINKREKDDTYYYGTAARFDNNINLVFFFNNLTDDMSVKFKYTPFNKQNEVIITLTSKDFKTYQGRYAVELNNLVVADARQIITCELYDGKGNVIATIKDSVESYVARNEKGDNIFTNFMKFADSSSKYLEKKN